MGFPHEPLIRDPFEDGCATAPMTYRAGQSGEPSEATPYILRVHPLGHTMQRASVATAEPFQSSAGNDWSMIGLRTIFPISELHPLHIQRLYGSLLEREPPLSAGTVLNLHLVLHQALGQAFHGGASSRTRSPALSPLVQ